MKTIKFLFIGIISILLINCKGPEIITVPLHDSTFVETTETITDTPTYTEPESLLYQFAVECDENYRAILKQLNEANSGIKTEIEIKETIVYREDGTKVNRLEFDISVYIDSIQVQNRTIERLRKVISSQDVPVPVEIPVKYVPKYHKFTAWAFPVLIILIFLYIYMKLKTSVLKRA